MNREKCRMVKNRGRRKKRQKKKKEGRCCDVADVRHSCRSGHGVQAVQAFQEQDHQRHDLQNRWAENQLLTKRCEEANKSSRRRGLFFFFFFFFFADTKKLIVEVDEIIEGVDLRKLAEDLPDSVPRYIVLSYEWKLEVKKKKTEKMEKNPTDSVRSGSSASYFSPIFNLFFSFSWIAFRILSFFCTMLPTPAPSSTCSTPPPRLASPKHSVRQKKKKTKKNKLTCLFARQL